MPRFVLLAASLPLNAATTPTEAAVKTEDAEGMSAARAAALLPAETAMIGKGRFREAERSLARRIAAERTPRRRADLTEAFGIQILASAPKIDDASASMALDYLGRAVDAYRLVLGVDHQEVATALVRRAEVERLVRPESPALWTDLAYEQAYRIRVQRLGPASLVTLSTLIPMAELKRLRAEGSVEGIEAAAAMLNQVVDGAAQTGGSDAKALQDEAMAKLQRLQQFQGPIQADGRRPQILAGTGLTGCAAAELNDTLIFSGEPAALNKLRNQFRKAKLEPKPCGSLLILQLGPGVDPSPVVDLLTDISAGRVPGVRMGLSASNSPGPSAEER